MHEGSAACISCQWCIHSCTYFLCQPFPSPKIGMNAMIIMKSELKQLKSWKENTCCCDQSIKLMELSLIQFPVKGLKYYWRTYLLEYKNEGIPEMHSVLWSKNRKEIFPICVMFEILSIHYETRRWKSNYQLIVCKYTREIIPCKL